MQRCEIIVENYGKIQYARLKPTELMLFVGDNNSGKSYLLSLLWGIQNLGMNTLIPNDFFSKNDNAKALRKLMMSKMQKCFITKSEKINLDEFYDLLENTINESLQKEKDNIVKKIFNSDTVTIGSLQILFARENDIELEMEYHAERSDIALYENKKSKCRCFIDNDKVDFSDKGNTDYGLIEEKLNRCCLVFIMTLYSILLKIEFQNIYGPFDSIYLPAARTGFMLTKNIINQVGRDIAFNTDVDKTQVIPFIRPINAFLDVINSLSLEESAFIKYKDIIEYLEHEMTSGTIEISDMPSKEIFYVPRGKEENIPLRVVSAVVSELAPLVLILKHFGRINTFYYEEPEMCLHPQLQNNIARVICRLVNCGTNMVVTTHSDIIIQYINNMIALGNRADRRQICESLGYSDIDILTADEVSVYQLKCTSDNVTTVENIPCGKNGFVVDSFNDALDKIMNEAYVFQE